MESPKEKDKSVNPSQLPTIPQSNLQATPYHAEDEISITELIEILLKNKAIIIGTVIVSLLIASIYLIIVPPQYRIYMLVRPGGNWSEESIATIFDNKRNYEVFLPQNLLNQDKDIPPEITATYKKTPAEKGAAIITLEMFHHDKNFGIEVLKAIINNINNYYTKEIKNSFFAKTRLELENKLQELKEQLQAIDIIESTRINMQVKGKVEKIELLTKKIKMIREEKEIHTKSLYESQGRLSEVLKNSSTLMKERDKLSSRGSDISSLLFTTVVQQNIAYASDLQKYITSLMVELAEKEIEEANTLNEISQLQKEIDDLKLKIEEELRLKKESLKRDILETQQQLDLLFPIEQLSDPVASLKPVKPKKTLTLALSLTLGCFMGIMLAFAKHAWTTRSSSLSKT